MARHGSVGAFSGFSVCQPALGASLQWLPAIGTAELDDMINAFLPGPASIQDKRAHISMDFFEYSRQTGENFKFYPVPSGSFTPVTASPATSALYDSASVSSFNHSPVFSEGSWTQSPAPFAPAASEARTKSRSSVSKKSSTSSSRQQAVDFANHPGMRILTKDGRDVTNSASRGCKTKEQRDHAHLMRIIKACDSCRKKKIRCDPSHRKRNASQASTTQAEQKPAKRPRKADAPAPVAVVDAPTDFAAGDAFTSETLGFPSFDPATYPQEFDEFFNDFVTLDQEPVALAPAPAFDDFVFDSFTDLQSFFSPSSGSTATSPSQILTPITPPRSGASPTTASDVAVDVAADVTVQDATVPYLNPGVAHGTDYVDFDLYSPGADVFNEDPVLQMIDLGNQQQSPQSPRFTAGNTFSRAPQASATDVRAGVATVTSMGEESSGNSHNLSASPVDLNWYYDPGDTGTRLMTNHNRLLQEDGRCRSPTDGQPTNHHRLDDGRGSEDLVTSSVLAPVSQTSAQGVLHRSTSTVFANIPQSSVSPGTSPRPRRITPASPGGRPAPLVRSLVATKATESGMLESDAYAKFLLPNAAVCRQSSQNATSRASPAACEKSCNAVGVDAALAGMPRAGPSCLGSFVSMQRVSAARESGSSALLDGQSVMQQATVAVNAVLATMLSSTLPTRCNVAGEGVLFLQNNNTFFFQLAVLGLVSFLCASALQAHLGIQVSLLNILGLTTPYLARLAPRCAGLSSATWVASKTLPSPPQQTTPSGIVDNVKSKIQSVVTGSSRDSRSAVSRWRRSVLPRLPSVRTLRL